MQPRKELLKEKARRVALEVANKRFTLSLGDTCVVVFKRGSEEDVRDGFVKEVHNEDDLFIIAAGYEYVFSKRTRKCLLPEGKQADVLTTYEWTRLEFFRKDVLPKLKDLAEDYKEAGDATIAELKVLSAVLQLALNQREGRR